MLFSFVIAARPLLILSLIIIIIIIMWMELRVPTFRTIVVPSSSKGAQEGGNFVNVEHSVVPQGTSRLYSTTVITWYGAKHVSL